jgi:hypothetical protein
LIVTFNYLLFGVMCNEDKKSWIERHLMAWDLFLVFFGFMMGFAGTMVYDYHLMRQADTSTSRFIYNELNDPQNQVEVMAPYYLNNEEVLGDSFYPSDSVFPLAKSDIKNFNDALINNLTGYDESLRFAERDRLLLIEMINRDPNSTATYYQSEIEKNKDKLWEELTKETLYCYNQTPIIKKQLHDEYGINPPQRYNKFTP